MHPTDFLAFWPGPVSIFGPTFDYDTYQRFTYVNHAIRA